MKRFRCIEHLELILDVVELLVGGGADIQHVIQPSQIPVRTTATELRRKVVLLNRCTFGFCEFPDGLLAANVAECDALILVDEKDRALGRLNELLDLVFTQVAVKPTLFVETMGFVDDQHVEAVRLRIDKGTRACEHIRELAAGDGTDEL
ncbi:hypothetical protein D9M69_377130 [compost metagenome]